MKAIKDIGARKWWATGAITLAAIAFSLDLTVLNLALPTLSRDLHASTNQLQWIVDAYSLILAILTLPAGMLGDRYGRKKYLLFALLVFGGASVWCAYASSVSALIMARIALGIGAAFILPLALSVIPVFFSDKERPRAIALLMGGVFLSYPLGPILGGWLLTHYWWGSVFLINVPVVALALLVIALLLPETKGDSKHPIDFIGVLLSSVGLTGITYGAIEAGSKTWGNTTVLSSLVAGVTIIALFIWWERRVSRRGGQPLVDLALFSSKQFNWGTILSTSVNFSMFGLLFCLPQYFQAVQGHNALAAGYRLLSMIGGLVVGSVISGKFAPKMGAKLAVAFGFLVMAAGLFIGSLTTIASSDPYIVLWTAIVGLGLGLAMPSAADAALSAFSKERSGSGSALMTAVRQVGGTLGVAVLGTLLSTSYRSQLHLSSLPSNAASAVRSGIDGGVAVAHRISSPTLLHQVRTAFIYGMHEMLLVSGGIALIAVILALLFLPNKSSSLAPKEK